MLTRKDVKWIWGESQQKAFDELKGVFTTKLALAVKVAKGILTMTSK